MSEINTNGKNGAILLKKGLGLALIGFTVYTLCKDDIDRKIKDVAAHISRKEES